MIWSWVLRMAPWVAAKLGCGSCHHNSYGYDAIIKQEVLVELDALLFLLVFQERSGELETTGFGPNGSIRSSTVEVGG